MNREIKFRGKRIDNGEWIEGDLVHFESGSTFILSQSPGNEEAKLKNVVDPSTLVQFTGLYDISGREIYEGDIVSKCIDCGKKRVGDQVVNDFRKRGVGVVVWDEYTCRFKLKNLKDGTVTPLVNSKEIANTMFKVLGNLHDQSEQKGGDEE